MRRFVGGMITLGTPPLPVLHAIPLLLRALATSRPALLLVLMLAVLVVLVLLLLLMLVGEYQPSLA